MSRLFTPLIQLFDASGATAGSGTLTFFAQGTNTLQATYQDAARTLANTNPITVDGSGLSPAIYLQYLDYTVLAEDSDGGELWIKDFDGRWLADGSDYSQSATATARTVQSRLANTVYADDYGTAGNGSTDDRTEIQAAIDATPAGGILIFTPGTTYEVSEFFTCTSAITLWAYGATIQWSSALASGDQNEAIKFTASDSWIRGGKWKHRDPSAMSRDTGQYGIWFEGTVGTNLNNVGVIDADFEDWLGHTVVFRHCSSVFRAEDNTFNRVGYSGITTLSSSFGFICDNFIKDVHPGGSLGDNAYGITITKNNASEATRPLSHDIVVAGNTVDTALTWEGISTHGGYNIMIANNVLNDCRSGVVATRYTGGPTAATDNFGPRTVAITGNTIRNTLANFAGGRSDLQRGIIVSGTSSGGTDGSDITITGNSLTNCGGQETDDEQGAIEVHSITGLTVSGNVITNSGSNSILLLSTIDFTCANNSMTDINPTNDPAQPSGTIVFDDNPSNNETLTLNGLVFTFKDSPSASTDIQIGGDLPTTLDNILSTVDTEQTKTDPPSDGRIQILDLTEDGADTLTAKLKWPTRALGTNVTLATNATTTSKDANLDVPSADSGAFIVLDKVSGGAAPDGFVGGNSMKNTSATQYVGIKTKSIATETHFGENIFTGEGVLYDLVGASTLDIGEVDSLFTYKKIMDLPSIAAAGNLDIYMPLPSGNKTGIILEWGTTRHLEGLVVTFQPQTRGYIIAQFFNPTAGAVDLSSIGTFTLSYSVRLVSSLGYGTLI